MQRRSLMTKPRFALEPAAASIVCVGRIASEQLPWIRLRIVDDEIDDEDDPVYRSNLKRFDQPREGIQPAAPRYSSRFRLGTRH
jgi:hypothetical protein